MRNLKTNPSVGKSAVVRYHLSVSSHAVATFYGEALPFSGGQSILRGFVGIID